MTGRLLPIAIISTSYAVVVLFLYLSPSCRELRAFIPIAVAPFAILAFAVARARQSRFAAAICTLAVVFGLGGVVFHFLDRPNPNQPDPELLWVLFLSFAVPLESLLAGVMLIAVSMEQKKMI